jgi:small redox-active disulfide protein 2
VKIEVLGSGCPKCMMVESNVRKALEKLSLEAEVVHVRDLKEIAKRGVIFTPGVVIDGKVMAAGKIPKTEEIEGWIGEASRGGSA